MTVTDRYDTMDREALLQSARRADRELTMLWEWYDNLSHWIEQTVTCGYCGAGDAEPCRTVRGHHPGTRAAFQHTDRWRQMCEIRGEWTR